jgi:predicted nuclease of predicted toxin-antitoxin system
MMRILADQDVWRETVELLRAWGHDVLTACEAGLSRASDRAMLAKAEEDARIFITRDSDFGSLVFLEKSPSEGVVLLRIAPETKERVHSELAIVLNRHNEEELRRCFCTVEPGRHRIRHTPLKSDR